MKGSIGAQGQRSVLCFHGLCSDESSSGPCGSCILVLPKINPFFALLCKPKPNKSECLGDLQEHSPGPR